MRFIIKLILVNLFLISIIYESKCDFGKKRLSRILDIIDESRNKQDGDDLVENISKNIDMDCVKNLFKWPQNEKMLVNEIEQIVFTVAASLKCSDEEKAFQHVLDDNVHSNLQDILTYLKWQLQRIEPASKLVENFEINKADLKKYKKKIFFAEALAQFQENLEKKIGPLSKFSCGAITDADDYLKFVSKGAIIKYDDISEELKETEMEKLKEYLKEITFNTFDCIIKRFEDDPIGRNFFIFCMNFFGPDHILEVLK